MTTKEKQIEDLASYSAAILQTLELVRETLDPYSDEEIVPTDPDEFSEFTTSMTEFYDDLLSISDEVEELLSEMEEWKPIIDSEDLFDIDEDITEETE